MRMWRSRYVDSIELLCCEKLASVGIDTTDAIVAGDPRSCLNILVAHGHQRDSLAGTQSPDMAGSYDPASDNPNAQMSWLAHTCVLAAGLSIVRAPLC